MKKWTVKFDHAAVALEDLPAFKRVLEVLGLEFTGDELVKEQGVRTHFYRPDQGLSNVELLEPVDLEGTVAAFLKKRGPGIHHLSFQVSDIVAASTALKDEGIKLIYDAPKNGAHDTLVNFVHPKSAGGILVEISQKRAK